jgi:DNA-binding transcriptional regulator YiaG
MSTDAARFAGRAKTSREMACRKRLLTAAAVRTGMASPSAEELSLPGAIGGSRGPNKPIGRSARAVSEEERKRSAEIAAFRKEWRLSQTQFASLLISSTRTVRHWERGEFSPTPLQQRILGLLVAYVEREGLQAFHERFVGEAPRYGRAGRPTNNPDA